MTPPCGVPAVRGTTLPSSICTGAFSQPGGDWIRTIGTARRYASVSGEADQRVATSAPGRPQGGNPTGSATSARPSTGRNDNRSDPGCHSWCMHA